VLVSAGKPSSRTDTPPLANRGGVSLREVPHTRERGGDGDPDQRWRRSL